MKVENFFTELEELMQDFALFKNQDTLVDEEKEIFEIWAEFRRYIAKHDTKTLDWDNQDPDKFFVYAFTDNGELRIGKTNKYITPFVCYASSPQIIKGAVDHIGEEKLKKLGLEMPYKESRPLICLPPKEKGKKKIGLYDENFKLIATFPTQLACSKAVGISQGSISTTLTNNKNGFKSKTRAGQYIKYI